MRVCRILTALATVGLLASAAAGAEPAPAPARAAASGAMALVPDSAVAFFHLPSVARVDADLKRFADQTGWQIGHGPSPVLDIMAHRTGLTEGLDPAGSACIAFVDPKQFRERYTVYILPVADWDALLKAAKAEEMSPGLYALTGTAGPRFVARRGAFALVTSSIRTMDAVVAAGSLAPALPAETLARAAGEAPMVYIHMRALKDIYEPEIASWFRASTGQIYNQANSVPYADMLVTYMLGIADFIDQMETIEASLGFGPEGVTVDLGVRFLEGAGMADFLSAQTTGTVPIPTLSDRPVASATTLRVAPNLRSDFVLRATKFFLESAPRPEPLEEPTKKKVYEAMGVFIESLGENMTFLSAPAAPGMGMESAVTVFDITDAAQFRQGVELMVAAWETLADQLDLYLKFQEAPSEANIAGVEIITYVPRLRFGLPARHVEFRKRLRTLYGPEGLVYRIAVVGKHAVVATGSDLSLFRMVIEQLQKGDEPAPSPALQRLHTHVSRDQNVFVAMSLPIYLAQSLERGGTSADRIGTVDPGHEMVGIALRGQGPTAVVTTYWPHEQIRMARDLMKRAAPEL
ncbi:MAG: hypothetical protein IMZ66_06780, partial [Planctomycetes bacterium]|nr:hypothetical protein [Planctomycetota bacterium]